MTTATVRHARNDLPVDRSGVAVTSPPSGLRPVDLAPPFRLPGEHFSAGLGFLALGAVGLVWTARPLAAGAYASPRVMAVTHLFTLGWITTSIMGALYQFLPVALRAPIRSERLARATLPVHAAGVIGLVGGLGAGHRVVTLGGAMLLALGLTMFVANLAATLARTPVRNITWWCVTGAGAFLLAVLAMGCVLTLNLGAGFLAAGRPSLLAVHVHVALAGWVLLTIIGVGHRLLPMFLLSHGAPRWPGVLAAVATGAGGVVLLLSIPAPAARVHGYALLILGASAFVAQCGLWFRHRLRRRIDPGMRLVAVAVGSLAIGLLLGVSLLLFDGLPARVRTSYAAALVVGAASLFVAGHYYKIVPFLTWYHRFGPVAAETDVPKVADLYSDRLAGAAVVLLGGGAALLVAGVLAGAVFTVLLGSVVFLLGVAIEAGQLWSVSRRRP